MTFVKLIKASETRIGFFIFRSKSETCYTPMIG